MGHYDNIQNSPGYQLLVKQIFGLLHVAHIISKAVIHAHN